MSNVIIAPSSSQVLQWYTESREWRRPLDNKVIRFYEQFRQWLNIDETYAWQSQIFIPEPFTIIWTALPALLEAMMNQPPFIKVSPLRKDAVEGSKFYEKMLEKQLERIGSEEQSLYMILLKWWQDTLLYGNGYVDVGWKLEEGIKRHRRPVYNDQPIPLGALDPNTGQQVIIPPGTLFLGYEEVTEEVALYDDPDIVNLDWMQVFPDPFSKAVQGDSSRYIITRDTWTPNFIDQLRGRTAYKNLHKVTFDDTPEDNIDSYDSRKDIDEVNPRAVAPTAGKKSYAEVLKCQYKKKDGKHWREWWTIVANRNTVIFDGPNPYYHDRRTVVKADCFPLNQRFYSVGLLEPVEDLNDGINQRYNQSADITTMILSPMHKISKAAYDRTYDMFQGNIPSTPGLLIPLEGNEDISPITQLVNTVPAFDDLAYLKSIQAETTGTQAAVRGSEGVRKETATQVVEASTRSTMRFRIIMKILWYTSIRPMVDQITEMNYQFKVVPEEIRIRNEQGEDEWKRVAIDDVPYGGYAFKPNMTFLDPGASKEIRKQRFQEFIQIAGAGPLGNILNWREIGNAIFELSEVSPDTDRFIKTEQQIQQEQAQILAQALAQEVGGNQGGV